MRRIDLNFTGYWREKNKSGLEKRAGIYCVYAGTYNRYTDKVDVQRLLYIGKASDINNRIGGDNHEHLEDWKQELLAGQELMYSCAFESDRNRRTIAEAALIFHCKPPINEDGTDGFHHPDTQIVVTGDHKFIDASFLSYNTDA